MLNIEKGYALKDDYIIKNCMYISILQYKCGQMLKDGSNLAVVQKLIYEVNRVRRRLDNLYNEEYDFSTVRKTNDYSIAQSCLSPDNDFAQIINWAAQKVRIL
jgi:hypothetical protein